MEFADLLWPQIFGQFAEAGGEAINVVGVRIDGARSHIAEQHILGHSIRGWILTLGVGSHIRFQSQIVVLRRLRVVRFDFPSSTHAFEVFRMFE